MIILNLFGGMEVGRLAVQEAGIPVTKYYSCEIDKYGILIEGYIRKLTPIECERLQTLPDNYTAIGDIDTKISNSQRYKMLGNGWTKDVIKHILKQSPIPKITLNDLIY